ncbi:MAG TPA: glycosyltransferase [Pseudonocardiaceae bacterium]|nr:glycosyltransferase [Pseudonocardiaceae bacterium]
MGNKAMIIAWGSRGDVAPYTGVGAHLRAAGYEVTVAAGTVFADLVTDAGLEFEALAGDMRAAAQSEHHTGMARDGVASRSGVKMLRAAKQYMGVINADIARVAAASSADIMLITPMASAAYHVALARKIPTVGLSLQQHEPTSEFPPTAFGRSLGPLGNRVAGQLIRQAERMFFAGINDIRAEHGVPPATFAATHRQQAETHWPVLHGISRHVVPQPRDWRPGLDIVGYWWPALPPGWTPPEELTRFLDAGAPPVFVGFGSTNPGDAEHLSRTVTAALRKAGRRGVIQAGWANLSTSDDDMLAIGDIPHEWLFPRMAAVVHAAGAGTTAAGLRAVVPAVPIPITGDGPFWSYRLTTLGTSPGPIRFKKLSVDGLADAVREATTNPGYATRARELANRIATENGADAVLETVNQQLERG